MPNGIPQADDLEGFWVMKIKEMRQLSDIEMGLELERLRRHLFDLRSQSVTEKLEDTTMVGKAKRDIARLLTLVNERASAPA